jgi:hypothetical protein
MVTLGVPELPKAWVASIAFTPDGIRIAAVSSEDETIKVWDAATRTEKITLRGHKGWLSDIVFSPDGSRIAAPCQDHIKLWDGKSGSELMTLRGHKDAVLSIAFSPDSTRIASASQDSTAKIWDVASLREPMTLRGHADVVLSIAFSPDGKRIVSGGRDRTIRLWDVTTGTELLTLRAESAVAHVAFSPDGKTISSFTWAGTIVLYESTIPTDGYRPRLTTNIAKKVVDELYQKYNLYYEVVDKLQSDKTLDESVCKIALQIANSRLWEDTEKLAKKVVDELYKQYNFYYEVIDKLNTDKALAEPVRKVALQIADSRKWQDAQKLNDESWDVVRSSTGEPNAYKEALNKAEKAVSLEPNDLNILNTLGVARYRVGAYQDALMTLSRADKMRTDANEPSAPEDLAFIAMSLHKLGRADEAKAALEQLRSLCKEERFAEDQEAQAFLTEAEQLITGEKQ